MYLPLREFYMFCRHGRPHHPRFHEQIEYLNQIFTKNLEPLIFNDEKNIKNDEKLWK